MTKVAIVTNIPAPYRVDLFYYLQTHIKEYEFHIIYTSWSEDNRQWSVSKAKLLNSYILSSKVLKIQGRMDSRYVHIPSNIAKVLSSIDPGIVIAVEYNPAAIQALLWCTLHRRKFIHLTDGTLHSERNIGLIQKLTRKLIIRSASAGIASSTMAKEKLLYWGMDSDRIFTSLLTMDLEKYRNILRTPVPGTILYVGSLVKRKGLDLLIRALPFVEENINLRIVGNGTEKELLDLQTLASKLCVASKITWCGYLEGPDLLREYASASVFVLPTREDCYGLVLLEAYCARIPIVSSKYADGAYDIVREESGMIVDPYDAKALASALNRILTDTSYEAVSKSNDIDKFDFSNTIQGILNAIQYVQNSGD